MAVLGAELLIRGRVAEWGQSSCNGGQSSCLCGLSSCIGGRDALLGAAE